MVQHIKATSSKWVKLQRGGDPAFAWQSGYAAISFGGCEMQAILEYIENQEFHHKKWSFQEEYRSLLEEFGIEYDERYMWD